MNTAPALWQDVAARLRPALAHRVAPTEIDEVLQDVLTATAVVPPTRQERE
jgi:hypothetical protein